MSRRRRWHFRWPIVRYRDQWSITIADSRIGEMILYIEDKPVAEWRSVAFLPPSEAET